MKFGIVNRLNYTGAAHLRFVQWISEAFCSFHGNTITRATWRLGMTDETINETPEDESAVNEDSVVAEAGTFSKERKTTLEAEQQQVGGTDDDEATDTEDTTVGVADKGYNFIALEVY